MLEWIDKSAYACAAAWSGHYCVTAYVGNVRFHQPLHVGDLVEVQARLIHTGTSSMHVSARVRSGNPRTGELIPIAARRVVTFHASQKLKSQLQADVESPSEPA